MYWMSLGKYQRKSVFRATEIFTQPLCCSNLIPIHCLTDWSLGEEERNWYDLLFPASPDVFSSRKENDTWS